MSPTGNLLPSQSLRCTLLISVLLCGSLFCGETNFIAPLTLSDVARPVTVWAGDLNRDGKLDLAAANGSGTIELLFQDPDRRDRWERGSLRVGSSCFFVRLADFDEDGADDIVVADPATTAYFIHNKGDGTFDAPVSLKEAHFARWITVADWNKDGNLDLASANFSMATVSIFLGDGKGKLAPLKNYIIFEPHAVEALDYDGDGNMDFMVGHGDHGIRPYHGKGDGSFDNQPLLEDFPPCARFVFVGDFNKDGRGDLALTCLRTALDGDIANALAGFSNGNGTYTKTIDIKTRDISTYAVADLDGDQNQDLALADVGSTRLSVFRGKGDGAFLPPVALGPTGESPSFVTARDLDGDGRNDVVSADTGSSTLTVFWGTEGDPFLVSGKPVTGYTGTGSAVADFDQDGTPDFFFARPNQRKIEVFLNPGLSAATAPSFTIDTQFSYSYMVAIDINGDKIPDLAGASLTGSTALVAILDATGKARDQLALPAGNLPSGITAGKIDEGETMDLAVPCLGSNHVAIFLGKGDGSFDSPRVVPTLDKPKGVALGDLDLDGHADLFVAGLHSAAVHFGKGSGEFGEPVLLLAEEARRSYWSPAIADISGDSIPDLLVADAGSKNVLFLRGKGGRQFEEGVPIAVSGAPRSIVAVDVDGDGLLDVTTANNNQNLSLIFNLGQEGFQAPVDLHDGLTNVSGHQVLDLNRDGVLDLVAFGPGSSIIFFGRSKSTPAPGRFRRGDVDGNAKVQVSDAIVLLNHLFRGGALDCQDAGDTDDNGEVNLTDAVVTLRWLFQGGSPPGPPGPEDCGADPTRDELKECKPECR